MPTTRTVTVMSSGGDYTTLAAAEAAEQGDLVSLDRLLVIECHNIAETSTGLTIDGWTTDATRYIEIRAAQNHNGIWGTSSYRITRTGAANTLIISEQYVRLIGLQLLGTGTSNAITIVCNASGDGDIRLVKCISVCDGSANAINAPLNISGTTPVTVINCIFLGGNSSVYATTGTQYLYNCTFARSTAQGVYAFSVCYAENCFSVRGFYNSVTTRNCVSTTARYGVAVVPYTTATFENVTSGTEDLRLKTDCNKIMYVIGSNLSSLFTDDITGTTRTLWTIGAHEGGTFTGTSPTTRTVTVKSSGGDYTSLSAAEAAEQGDLVTLNRNLVIECYDVNDTTAVTIDGWTMDPVKNLQVLGMIDHGGVWSTSAYRLNHAGGYGSLALIVNEEFTVIENIQVQNTYNGLSNTIRVTLSFGWVTIKKCLSIHGVTTTPGSSFQQYANVYTTSATYLFLENCVLINGAVNVHAVTVNNGVVFAENCTFLAAKQYGVQASHTTVSPRITNTYIGGFGTDAYLGTSIRRFSCAHSSATVYAGSTASIAYDTSNFTNVTAGSEDPHLVSGASSTLKTGGTQLYYFTQDIDSETRVAPWSIGADQIIIPEGHPTTKRFGGVPFTIQGGNVFGGHRRW
jgi:hypothetical protein